MTDEIFVAKESFTTTLDGQSIVVNKGVTRVRAGHPLLKGRMAFFEPLTVHYEIERATAGPGERRGEAPAPAPKPAEKPDETPPTTPATPPETTPSKSPKESK